MFSTLCPHKAHLCPHFIDRLRTPHSVLRTPYSALRTSYSALRTPRSVLRAPYSALRTPRSVLRAPYSALRTPRSVLRAPYSVLRTPSFPPCLIYDSSCKSRTCASSDWSIHDRRPKEEISLARVRALCYIGFKVQTLVLICLTVCLIWVTESYCTECFLEANKWEEIYLSFVMRLH